MPKLAAHYTRLKTMKAIMPTTMAIMIAALPRKPKKSNSLVRISTFLNRF
jgi:hypothetical protein